MTFSLALLASFTAITPVQAVEARLLYKLTAPDAQPGAGFGHRLTVVDGDILVSANTHLEQPIDALGKAYLFDGKTGQFKFAFSNPEPTNQDQFAYAAAGGDGQVFLSTIGLQERVYAFSAATGAYLGKIVNPEPVSANFGGSIAYGAGGLLVSAPSFDDPANNYQNDRQNIGQAYLFNANTRELELTIPNPEPDGFDAFGDSGIVVNRDSILISCISDGPPIALSNLSGRVWKFDRQTGQSLAALENPNHTSGFIEWDWFGFNVAANDKFIVVSADEEDTGGIYGSGAAYVFDAQSRNLLHTLISPNLSENSEFGRSLAISPAGTILVGEFNASLDGVSGRGYSYLYDASSGQLLCAIPNPEPSLAASFGWSVAITENRLYISSPNAFSANVPYAGAVYVYEIIPEPPFWLMAMLVTTYVIVSRVWHKLRCKSNLIVNC